MMFNFLSNDWLIVAGMAMTPLSEVRGAILTGIGLGLNPFAVFWIAVLFNSLVFIPVYFGMHFFYNLILSKIWFINKIIEFCRTKIEKYVQRWEYIGIILYIGLFPVSGPWSATIAVWLLEMDWRKAWTSMIIGILIAGMIVLAGTMGLIKLVW